jgi:hypothetical protein
MRLGRLISMLLFAAVSTLAACGKTPGVSEVPRAAPPTPPAQSVAPTSSSAELRVVLYPGLRTLVEPHRVPLDKRGYTVMADFKSDHAPDKVAAFYRTKLGKQFGGKSEVQELAHGGGMTSFQAGDGQGQGTTVVVIPEGTGSIVGVQTIVKTN